MELYDLTKYRQQIDQLCLDNGVKSLFVFGSILTPLFNSESDIDLIVDIESNDPFEYADHYFNLKFNLQELLKRPIDLLENKAIKNPYLLKELNDTKVLIYGK